MVKGSDTSSDLGGSVERDYQRFGQLLKLWSQENAIKTQKLQYFLLTNAVLTLGYTLAVKDAESARMVCAIGAALSLIWMLSLGRTILFQKRWQALMAQLSAQYESDSRFQILTTKPSTAQIPTLVRLVGGVSSKYYLIGAPALGIVFWLWRL